MTRKHIERRFEPAADRVIREPERKYLTGVGRTTWYRNEREGKAPRRVPLGDSSHGWMLSEINQWIEERKADRANRLRCGNGGRA